MANRRKQIEALQKKASELSDEMDALAIEMQESLDNMPESLQQGDRGETMQERIDAVETVRDALTDFAEEEL